ncbi:type I glyceraldehyde-3-phosphate dehydrogenase [Paenibacillus sp. 481]|uniref:type I glyceraldehyde-3-phosphate dehydrogenase n=1 Tax=Paenibacillus sp. 481 TaxID=2835869 RepID=UPI001E47CFFB|nr:type I glyceraldehyde-3-phosphate dehydrogenase [Paenibacillus sp. 481]UHA74092.1 type I glyceraldehyde-3-phosphate dehydrogenase [Paenibacillus sp. 481]
MNIGISGTGRIGRMLIRKWMTTTVSGVRLVAINTSCSAETLIHLLKYDSVHGRWDANFAIDGGDLLINGQRVRLLHERNPELIPWRQCEVSVVIDATGAFNHREGSALHLAAGAERVIITAPGKEMDLTVVMGVNEHRFQPERHKLLSAASCTTNCLAPVLYVLDNAFNVEQGWMTTVHAVTNDQRHLDNPHKDLRRARACTQSIVPTTTGVSKALVDVLPHLAPRLAGYSLRVPTQDVSVIDLNVQLGQEVTVQDVRQAFADAARGTLAPYIALCEEPLVSIDFVGCEKSAVVDSLSMLASGKQVKLLAWYDNEWGYVCRVADLVRHVTSNITLKADVAVEVG